MNFLKWIVHAALPYMYIYQLIIDILVYISVNFVDMFADHNTYYKFETKKTYDSLKFVKLFCDKGVSTINIYNPKGICSPLSESRLLGLPQEYTCKWFMNICRKRASPPPPKPNTPNRPVLVSSTTSYGMQARTSSPPTLIKPSSATRSPSYIQSQPSEYVFNT